jgi:hypothetical protein
MRSAAAEFYRQVAYKGSTESLLLEVFDREAAADKLMSEAQFCSACEALKLSLQRAELARVFAWATRLYLGQPRMDSHTFVQCVRARHFLAQVRHIQTGGFEVSASLDLERDTAANYDGGPGTPFLGPYRDIRATRDHDYHGRYTERRQRWQDCVLETVVQRTEPQPAPWLIFTCGGMGVGKGYALGWLSEQGIFPLEDIVHIDPDHFKNVMPEWDRYVGYAKAQGDPSLAGNRCHKESCYLQELALEEALRRKQNCWVDGSLRNAQWFTKVFEDIRERFPDYRVAIIAVRASVALVRQRVASRAAATGRSVPDELVLESLEAVDRSISILGPQADFVAEVLNEGAVPNLLKVTSIDRSGAWASLKQRFARTLPAPEEFPASLAPIGLQCLPEKVSIERVGKAHGEREASRAVLIATAPPASGGARSASAAGSTRHGLILDPSSPLSMDDAMRTQARVPRRAATFARFRLERTQGLQHRDVGGVSLTFGGFAYWDIGGELVGVNALRPLMVDRGIVSARREDSEQHAGNNTGGGDKPPAMQRRESSWTVPHRLDFGPQEHLSSTEGGEIPPSRWDEVLSAHRQHAQGARRVAWVMAYERLGGRMLSTGGGFAYQLETARGREYVFFPLLCD